VEIPSASSRLAEIAKAVPFLVDSDFVTGECLRVDDGRHLY
jgi:hypothetical protein